jgi:hypothetical protein
VLEQEGCSGSHKVHRREERTIVATERRELRRVQKMRVSRLSVAIYRIAITDSMHNGEILRVVESEGVAAGVPSSSAAPRDNHELQPKISPPVLLNYWEHQPL